MYCGTSMLPAIAHHHTANLESPRCRRSAPAPSHPRLYSSETEKLCDSLPSSLIPPRLCQFPFTINLFRPLFSLRQRCSTTESRPRTSHASLAPFIRLGKDHQLPVRESPCNWRCPSLPAPPVSISVLRRRPPLDAVLLSTHSP
ncbi:hypothetical protein V8C44DRAFT_339166 [Trichoderma aethiopicum]